jgi:hypothetical protein
MRVLLPFLVFINIAFYFWVENQEVNQTPLPLGKKVQNYATLQTVSERDAPVESLASAIGGSQVPLINRDVECTSLGPFTTVAELDVVYTQMINAGIDATQKIIQQRVPKSYWVYLVPHDSLESAYETTAYLEQKNVKEHFIMRAPQEKRFSISLGLFSELDPANELIKQIEKIDLEPKLEIRFDDVTEYWINYHEFDEKTQLNLLENILQQNKELLLVQSDCLQ